MIKKYKKSITVVFALALILTAVPLVSRALTAISGDNLVIIENVDGNFFGAGNLVVVNGTINGDVFVAGNSVSVRGIVNGDVFAAGSSVEISGEVRGSIRVLASNLNIRGRVEGNVLSAASSLILDEGAFVGGHITYAGAALVLNAPVGGQVDAGVPSAIINNSVGGNVDLRMGGKDTGLTILEGAILRGNLKYTASSEAKISEGAQVLGETEFSPWKPSKKIDKDKLFFGLKKFILVVKVISFSSMFVIGLLMIYFIPKLVNRVYENMKTGFWRNAGTGFVAVIIIPISVIFLLVTIIGIPLALLALVFYILAIYFAKVLAAITIGRFIVDSLEWRLHKILSFLLGLILFFGVGVFVPFIGWFAAFVVIAWTLGALLKVSAQVLKKGR